MKRTPGDRSRAEDIIVGLIAAAGSDGLKLKTRLFKAFYYAHLHYFRKTGDLLSAWPIVHMPKGAGIDEGTKIVRELIGSGRIRGVPARAGDYDTTHYFLGSVPKARVFDPQVQKSIRWAVAFVAGKSATDLSDLMHRTSESWKCSRNGGEMDWTIDTLSEPDLTEMQKRNIDPRQVRRSLRESAEGRTIGLNELRSRIRSRHPGVAGKGH
ncbi:MAG: hypothetical protein HYY93_14815 [Planctomycetes bacterium]|nr:hypothetical protein [Planctomycetota bacterium]